MQKFQKGDKVQDIFTGEIFIVKKSYLQQYDSEPDYTVEFEPAICHGSFQETPWNKSRNLRRLQSDIT